jgi:hypothetical protein
MQEAGAVGVHNPLHLVFSPVRLLLWLNLGPRLAFDLEAEY